MKIIRTFILGIAIAAILFELMFPPLGSSSRSYEPQLVDQHFVAGHLSRFKWHPGDVATMDNMQWVVRAEVDGGELLRELVFIVVLSGAAYLWLPALVGFYRSEIAQMNSEKPKP